jgi:PKHD-type hydroxylase
MIVLGNVLAAEELAAIREFLAAADFVDGKATAGGTLRNRKDNEQLQRAPGEALPVDQIVAHALLRHPILRAWGMPLRMSAPIFNRYGPGMHYGNHVDSPVAGQNPPLRADLSLTLFLSDPADYDGGELVVESAGGSKAAKLPAGQAFAYLSNALHRVNPVTRGERLAAVTWVQSMVPDDRLRAILFDLAAVEQSLTQSMPESPELDLLSKAHQNLMRLAMRV